MTKLNLVFRMSISFIVLFIAFSPFAFGSTVINTTTDTIPWQSGGRIICRTTNAVHMVYTNASSILYANSSNNGTTWNPTVRLDGSSNTTDDPGASVTPAMDCKGTDVIVLWSNAVDVFYRNSTNEGTAWNSLVGSAMATRWLKSPSLGMQAQSYFSLMFGINNNAWVSWNNKSGIMQGQTVITNSTSYGNDEPALTTVFLRPDSISNSGTPTVIVNISGTTEEVYVTYHDPATSDLFINYSTDGGSTWSGKVIAESTFVLAEVSSAIMNNTIYAVARNDSKPFGIAIYNSTNGGSAWSEGLILNTSNVFGDYPTIATDSVANIWVFWSNGSIKEKTIDPVYRQYNRSNGWTAEVRLESVNSSITTRPNAKWNASLNLVEVIFQNRTSGTGRIDIRYINLTANATQAGAVDITSPTWSSNTTNSTLAGTPVNHSVVLSDETALDYYIFEFDNGTSTFSNISTVDVSGTTITANQTVIINSTVGSTIRWRIYVNDTSNNWNATNLFSYTTTPESLGERKLISKNNAYELTYNDTTVIGRINNNNISTSITSGWHHITLVYNKDGGTSNFKLYIDSVLATSNTITGEINTNTNGIVIGKNFTGSIDEIKIWNRDLTANEIAFEYEASLKKVTSAGEIPAISENGNATIVLASPGSNYFDDIKFKAGKPKIRLVVPYQKIDIVNQTRFGSGNHNIVIRHYGTNTTSNRPMIGLEE